MDKIRVLQLTLCRAYATRHSGRQNPGMRRRMQLEEFEDPCEEFEPDDLAQFETDFMDAGKSYDMHKREQTQARRKLQRKIVARKYFKDDDPIFLTFIEKDQIQKLHKQDPEEWSIEKLSESFPALPGTIAKIIHSHWVPDNVDKILKYDDRVITNWKSFQAGKLPTSAALREHLLKFKDRKIMTSNRQSLAESLVVSEPKQRETRSKYFTNLIQKCIAADRNRSQELLAAPVNCKDQGQKQLTAGVGHKDEKPRNEDVNSAVTVKGCHFGKSNEIQTFSEFAEKNIDRISIASPQEGEVLLDLYKKHVESKKANANLESRNNPVNRTKNEVTTVDDTDKSLTNIDRPPHDVSCPEMDRENQLGTYIKAWNKKSETSIDYAYPIKIPKAVYKQGLTYRIKDCYYDDDGEFLYRVPGLKN